MHIFFEPSSSIENKNLTLKNDDIELIDQVFTPQQCQYIWDETEKFMMTREQSLKDTNVKPRNGYKIHNTHNYFDFGGVPAVTFLIIQRLAEIFANKILEPIDPSIINSDDLHLACSVEGFDFQRPEDDTPEKVVNQFPPCNNYSDVIRMRIQITPGQLKKSCFAFHKSDNIYRPFDDDTIRPGQLIFFKSNRSYSKIIVKGSRMLAFYVTCWQHPNRRFYKSGYNIGSLVLYNSLYTKIRNNRMTTYDLEMVRLNSLCANRSVNFQFRDDIKSHLMYYKHPIFDTDLLARLFGFNDAQHQRKSLSCEEKKNGADKFFTNMVDHPKTIEQIRRELYYRYNILKRKLDFEPPNNIITTNTSAVEPPPSKKQMVQIDTIIPKTNILSKMMASKDVMTSIKICQKEDTSYHDYSTDEDEDVGQMIVQQPVEPEPIHFKTLRLCCSSFYNTLVILSKLTRSNIFNYTINEIESGKFQYNIMTNTNDPVTDLNSMDTMIRVENDTKITEGEIILTVYEDVKNGTSLVRSPVIVFTVIPTTVKYLPDFFRTIRHILHPQTDFINRELVIQGHFSKWASTLYDNIVIHPNMTFSEKDTFRAFRNFTSEDERMILIVDDIRIFFNLDTILERIGFENPNDPYYKPMFLISEFIKEQGIFTNYVNAIRDTRSRLDLFMKQYEKRLSYKVFQYDNINKSINEMLCLLE